MPRAIRFSVDPDGAVRARKRAAVVLTMVTSHLAIRLGDPSHDSRAAIAHEELVAPGAADRWLPGRPVLRKLFEIDPKLRKLFADDLISQKIAIMAMIGRTVASLDRIESIVPEVKALGVRHVGYGVTPNDFPTVGAALL